jgi:hypothetical protein
MVSSDCPLCGGKRLRRESLSVTFAGFDITDISRLPLKPVGREITGADTGQHSYLPRVDGPRRASNGPVCGDFMGRNFYPGATGIFWTVPVALAAAGLSAEERNKNMTQKLTVVVTGATGKQGGAVARGQLKQGHKVRAVTRDPNSSQAKSLADAGERSLRRRSKTVLRLKRRSKERHLSLR